VIVTARSYLTAGLAAVSVGAVVAVPMAAHPPSPDTLMRSAQVQMTAAESQVLTGLAKLSAAETRALIEAVRNIVTTPVVANTYAPRTIHAAARLQAVTPGADNPVAASDTAQAPDAGQRSNLVTSTSALDPRAAAIVAIGEASIALAAIPAQVAFDLGVTAGQVILDLVSNVNDVVPDLVAGLKLTAATNSSLFQSETKVLADSIHDLLMPTPKVPDAPEAPAVAAMKSSAQADALAARVHSAAGEQTAGNGLHLHVGKGATATAPGVADTNIDTKDHNASDAEADHGSATTATTKADNGSATTATTKADHGSATTATTKADNGSVTKSHPAAGIASHIGHAVGQTTKPGAGEHTATAGAHAHASSAGANAGKKSDKKEAKHTA
jgi:hypothetical protein